MAKYIIKEDTYNKVLEVVKKRANHWEINMKQTVSSQRKNSYMERYREMESLLEELYELEEVES